VAEDNAAARALYAKAGFTTEGRRKAYYARSGAPAVDAFILGLNLAG
jgi:ribosomal-protein-alanine N-acetyltransferase